MYNRIPSGWMDRWVGGLMDGWTDGWMDGWIDRWMKYTEMWCCGSKKQNPLTLYKGGSGMVSQGRVPWSGDLQENILNRRRNRWKEQQHISCRIKACVKGTD